MAAKMTCRTFPTAFKLAAIKRLKAGEAVLPLARELGVSPKILHDWRKAWDLRGPAGLNRKRGPKPGPRKLRPLAKSAAKGSSGELASARANSSNVLIDLDNAQAIEALIAGRVDVTVQCPKINRRSSMNPIAR
jgi:transposase-like protein